MIILNVSTVQINSAKGPLSILARSPGAMSSQPLNNTIFIAPLLKAFDDVVFIGSINAVERHGLGYTPRSIDTLPWDGSLEVPIKRYPGKRVVLILKNLPFFLSFW